jgi:hypothetical protein
MKTSRHASLAWPAFFALWRRQDKGSARGGKWSIALLVAAVGLFCPADPAPGQDFVPFVIPARIDPDQALWITDWQPIKMDSARLAAGPAEHFHLDTRVRIWGVNLCFGANFPTHEDAPLVAQRLAVAGVNSVRCHHLDTSRWPNGIWNARDGKTIEPQALDRLDYFINELAQHGIWVNLNLHVGRAHSRYLGLPPTNTEFDKIVGLFTPALIDAQEQYARDLLTHTNPYRGGVRYADDPAVAFVEITNEDSFFMWGADGTLRALPDPYAGILRTQFNFWLCRCYGSDQALASAWGKDVEPLGQDMVYNGRFILWDRNRKLPEHWNLEQHEGCQATLSQARDVQDAVRIEVAQANETHWHLQLTQGGLKVVKGRYYTLSFEAAARAKRPLGCVVSQAHSPWANLGLSQSMDLTPDWQTFRFGFVATNDDNDARISFTFSGSSTPFHLTRVELRQGGQVGLAENESAATGTVALFHGSETTARTLDRMIFLAETEKAYFDGMRSYIKDDLGCGALVTGTIVFGPLGLYAQSDMDYIDSHAYWQHPTFPGRPWDSANWLIEQKPMTDHPDQATLFRTAAERLSGKPFTLSEYNHPAPLDAQAECVPMIASFAAAQDWDGIWLFDYSGSANAWSRENLSGFFDIDTNPAKWGFMRAGTAIFRDECIGPVAGPTFLGLAGSEREGKAVLRRLAEHYFKHGSDMLAVTGMRPEILLKWQQVGTLKGPGGHRDNFGSGTKIDWEVKNGVGLYVVQGRGASVYVGHAARFSEATDERITIIQPSFVALTMTALDGEESGPLERRDKVLITACGRCENTDMQFSADRRTVGRNWGKAPVRIEAVRGSVVLPEGRWTCRALAPDGSAKQEVPIAYENGRGTLTLLPDYGTMWYLLERQTQ